MNSHFSNSIEQLESGQRKHRRSILTHVKCIRKQEDRIDGLSLASQAVVFAVPINPYETLTLGFNSFVPIINSYAVVDNSILSCKPYMHV